MIKQFTDSIIDHQLERLWNTIIAYALYLIVWFPLVIALDYSERSIIVKVIADLRRNIFRHMNRLTLRYHEQRHSGDLISVITNDVGIMVLAFGQNMYNLVAVSITGVSAAVVMMILNWKLSLVVIAAGIFPLVINILFAKPLRKAGQMIQGSLGQTSAQFADLLAGFQVVRTFSLGEWILSRFGMANRGLLANSMHRVRLNSALSTANVFGSNLNLVLPMGVGMYMVISGNITFGLFMAVLQLVRPVINLVTNIGTTISGIQSSLAAADRILNLMDTPPEPESYGEIAGGTAKRPKLDSHIEFSDIFFGYEKDKAILHGMSFDVPEGKVAAFVGPSGGGKSTIFKLLLGCFPINQGGIFVKDKSVNAYPLNELRDLFAYIPQDAYLYSGSIMENIRYGRLDASDEEVTAASKAANAHDFISRFPEGYNTKVGERGARLSGGERQRIAIARALLKDAPILLLDEATSSLDSESEELVQQALHALMAGRTVLIIAHRLSTIERSDVIYVIDGGQVQESGNHKELLAMKGLYSHLYEIQFRDDA